MDQNFNRPTSGSVRGQSTGTNSSSNQAPNSSQTTSAPPTKPKPVDTYSSGKTAVFAVIFIVALAALGLAAFGLVTTNKKVNKTEQAAQVESSQKRIAALEEADKYTEQQVDKERYQALFLSTGQVYFGKITAVTRDTMKLEDIYYLKTGTVDKAGNPTPGTDVSLVKLGKELHAPDDTMFIERKNLTFWENLKSDGQVAQAIVQYKKTNQ